jgi:SAM-dependent methyltransferase
MTESAILLSVETGGRPTQATSFGAAAEAYARARPSYPSDALDWLLPPDAGRVLDLGAGTGKLTARLVERGVDVVAVDLSPAMLDQLSAALPGVDARVGTAEAIPAADADFDAVLVAQAWHWVDPRRAVPEIARVLRPAGRLGLVWNLRDESHDWVAQLGRLIHQADDQRDLSENPSVGAPFGPLERHDTHWIHTTTPHGVLDLVASRSYVITLPDDERATVLAAVADLLDNHPDLQASDTVEIPYRTRCWRTQLAGSPPSR